MTLIDLPPFVWRAGLAGVGVALLAGWLGSFVVWRRLAYFGDATSHAALLGVALSLLFAWPMGLGILAVTGSVAAGVVWLSERDIAADAALGVLSHGSLAVGLLSVALIPGPQRSLDAWLFGDILTVSWADIGWIWGGGALVGAVLAWGWGRLLLATLSPELARAAGVDPRRWSLVLAGLLAATVALAVQVVGALLVTAMLVIPPAAARALARSPEGMAMTAAGLGALSAILGLGAALAANLPVGPSTVTAALAIFAVAQGARALRR